MMVRARCVAPSFVVPSFVAPSLSFDSAIAHAALHRVTPHQIRTYACLRALRMWRNSHHHAHQFREGTRLHFLHYMCTMNLDGALTHAEIARNHLVCLALSDQIENLTLARAQSG